MVDPVEEATSKDVVELLGRTELIRSLSTEALATVAGRAETRMLQRNDVAFTEEDSADELFVIRDGRVAIAQRSPEGKESVVALLEAGDLFGEMPLFDGQGRSATARALETTEVIAVAYGPIREALEERPTVLWDVVELLALRLRSANAALADSMFLDVTGRTAKRLLELAGDSDDFVLPVTQEELAGMVGASRERVNKAISQFVRLGWLRQIDRRYHLLDREQMTRRAR